MTNYHSNLFCFSCILNPCEQSKRCFGCISVGQWGVSHTITMHTYLGVHTYTLVLFHFNTRFLKTTSAPVQSNDLRLQLTILILTCILSTARRSSHHFSNINDERAALIYNYKTTYVEDYLPVIQAYFFQMYCQVKS